jgi:lysophospholipase L1-like esterase
MDDGAHKIEVKVTSGTVRAFGATMERETGVVVDSLGIVSNTAHNMADIRGGHWEEQLAHRDADLLMVLLGTNESAWVNDKVEMKDLRKDWDTVLGRLRAGNPEASCLVIGTLDAGKWVDGKYVSRKSIPRMIEIERAAARAAGCGFWDARAYMGGKDSARIWKKRGLMAEDHEHLTGKGGEVLGSGIVAALEASYASHQSR